MKMLSTIIYNYLLTEYLYLSYLRLNMTDEAIFKLASKFTNVVEISIRNTITAIPTKAFHPVGGHQDKLRRLCFWYQILSIIGSNAFSYLNNLDNILFNQVDIKSIERYAFSFEKSSDNKLFIEFQNCVINGFVFGNNSFDGLKRPTYLIFNNTLKPNMVKHLNELSFLNFLLENGHYKIILINNELDYNDCRNAWIRQHEELQPRIIHLKCLDGKDFNYFKNFKNC